MLTSIAPLIAYLLSFPVMLLTVFRVEIGILFFITLIPIIVPMKKIVEFPLGHNVADFLLISMVLGWIFRALKENRKIFESSPVNFAVVLMVLWSMINLIGVIPPWNFRRCKSDTPETWKNYMILPLLYFITVNNIKTEKFLKWVIICVSLTMIAMVFNFHSTFRW